MGSTASVTEGSGLETPPEPWALPADEVVAALDTDATHGLTEIEVAARRERFGANVLEAGGGISLLRIALRQFQSPLIYILLAAGAISTALGEFIDAGVIGAVLGFNALIGFTQEFRAERSIEALQELARSHANVVRDGRERSVDARELVPGDLLRLGAGAKVPADARIVRGESLAADESILTGESIPVAKRTVPVARDLPVADLASMVFSGTAITRGTATAVVTATGAATALGAIAGSLAAVGVTRTPLQERMDRLANLIAVTVFVVGGLLFGYGAIAGRDIEELFFTLISLAVSAIPEGLPVVLTVALAVGVNRMVAETPSSASCPRSRRSGAAR